MVKVQRVSGYALLRFKWDIYITLPPWEVLDYRKEQAGKIIIVTGDIGLPSVCCITISE